MAIHYHFRGRLLVDHMPTNDLDENFSVQHPFVKWLSESKASIMVATSRMELADIYATHAMGTLASPDHLRVSRQEISNPSGGRIFYTSMGSALTGRRFDYIILSDPLRIHVDNPGLMPWVDMLRIKLPPN